MAIDRDIEHRTAVSITYTRVGTTLRCRERHGVKDSSDTIIITYDETKLYQGQEALDYLHSLQKTEQDLTEAISIITEQFTNSSDNLSGEKSFITAQIAEIEALL